MYQVDTNKVGRLIIDNAPERGIQPECHALPGNNSAVNGQPFPDDEMAFFWSGDNKHVVTRDHLDAWRADYCREILGYRHTTHCAPAASDSGSSICGATSQYLDVVEALRGKTCRDPMLQTPTLALVRERREAPTIRVEMSK
jgi:hypothetical protein